MRQLKGAAFRLTHNREDAEDLLQETLLRAFSSYDTFDGENPRGWLNAILNNTNISNYRHKCRRPSTSALNGGEDLYVYRRLSGISGELGRSAEEEVLVKTMASNARDIIANLPEKYRTPLTLADVEGLSYDDISQLLGIPVGTVMSRLYRARKTVRRSLWSQDQ
jgi:RNA polymerase sigma-70 factor (ECF subfamily)